tara:strand:- start:59 stop:1171 length:1113 start_codon:yes stop_codon:yes gene_type:complete
MRVPFNYLQFEFKEHRDIISKWRELILSTDYTLGKYVNLVEKKFSSYFNCKYVIAVNSGTDALILALKSLGIKSGDEVITAANTFYATAGAIVACGAKPILIDVNDNYQINEKLIEKSITKQTRAIIPVYWGGGAPEIESIIKIAKKYKIRVIEDSCMGIGGKVKNKHPGTYGDIGCFSFHPLKTINAIGDAGMICTNNKKIYKWANKYRNHGMRDRDNIDYWGVNMRMQPLQCIVVLEGLKKINKIISIRNKNAQFLDKHLEKIKDFVKIPPRNKKNLETYALYMIRVVKRDRLLKYLNEYGIEAKVHYPKPLCIQKPYLKYGYKNTSENALKHSKELITLPVHQYLNKKHLNFMLQKIFHFYKNNQGK